jgi:hypothetical protein
MACPVELEQQPAGRVHAQDTQCEIHSGSHDHLTASDISVIAWNCKAVTELHQVLFIETSPPLTLVS